MSNNTTDPQANQSPPPSPTAHAATMVYLLGVNFENSQLVRKALTSLYGISSTSRHYMARPPAWRPNPAKSTESLPSPARLNLLSRIMAQHYIHPTATLGSLSDRTITNLTETLTELTIENDLRRKAIGDITRLKDMGTYRGRRHVQNLPVRGQRTRSQITTARKLNRVERGRRL